MFIITLTIVWEGCLRDLGLGLNVGLVFLMIIMVSGLLVLLVVKCFFGFVVGDLVVFRGVILVIFWAVVLVFSGFAAIS